MGIIEELLEIWLNEVCYTQLSDVMNIKWDYGYYQLWSDNKWLVDKMLALLDKDITMQ